MTDDIARFRLRPVRSISLTVAATLLLAMPLPSPAQDTNPGDCAVNGDGDTADCAAGAPLPELTAPPAYTLDWAPIDAVPAGLVDQLCLLCGGRYVDPLAGLDRHQDPDEADIEARAARTELQGDIVRLEGGVDITQGYRWFRGETAVLDRNTDIATLTGAVSIREPGLLLQGRQAVINTRTGEATLEPGEFVMHEDHLQGHAELIERDNEALVYIHDGAFSFCPPGARDWDIEASKVDLDLEEGLGTAHHARVNVAGVPVFYTPWLQFPLDDRRRTGLLWPDLGNDSTGGLDITLPIYFNLAPNYDALYSPRFIENRGLNNELKLRYMHPYAGFWTVGGTYMSSDSKYADEVPPNKSDDRWLAVVRQNGLFDGRWRSRIDWSKVSDVDYMRDLQTSSLNAQRQTSLPQLGALDYLGQQWLVSLEFLQFQSLAEDINDVYQKKPQLTAQYRSSGTPFQLEPLALAQYSDFDSDDNVVTGQRAYGEAGLGYPMRWAYGYMTPKVKYRQLQYELSEGAFFTDDSPAAGSALTSVDSGIVLEREIGIADEHWLQTLEPRVYYLYAEYENQTDQPDFDSAELTFDYNQLFRESRFSGHDRLDDANQVAVGVTTRFIDTENGHSLLSGSLGQIFYFSDRKVRLAPNAPPIDTSDSELAAQLSFTPTEALALRGNLVWDRKTRNTGSGNVQVSYKADNGIIANAGYTYRRPESVSTLQPDTEQVTLSAYLPVSRSWRLFGAFNYSILDSKSIEDMFGVEYDDCCWTIRLLHLNYYDNANTGFLPNFNDPALQQEHTTQFQIIFKGMGGFGDRITNILEDMIRGYQEREY